MNLDSFIEIEELNEKEIKQVKEFVLSIKKSAKKQGNEECPLWQKGCNNQVCPMIKDNSGIWYSDEDVCNNPEYSNNLLVINQKKLKRKKAPGYFYFNMLNRKFIVGSGISGIDPDVPDSVDARGQKAVDKLYKDREEAWFNAHPELTEEQIKKMREHGKKNSVTLQKYRDEKNND